jgi:lysylphosphatidylglycerol synthetase-like protein (DUF2156 family)
MLTDLLAFLLLLTCFSVVAVRLRQFRALPNEESYPRPLAGRLLTVVICISQLFVASQNLLVAFAVLRANGYNQTAVSDGHLNAVIGAAFLLKIASTVLWFITAVGLWRCKFWAYYLAVLLNVFALMVSMPARFNSVSDVANMSRILLTLALLLVPAVRNQFRRDKISIQQSTANPD